MSISLSNSGPRMLVGIGNAGVAVLDRIAVEQPGLKGLLVINNASDSLASSVVSKRILFPEGNLSDGFVAIEEEFRVAINGAASVIFCGALGGEIGSFLLPTLAICSKAQGITTFASVGMPFAFEGRQKRELASTALAKLYDLCDGVAVIENDRLSGGVPSTAAIGEAFAVADRALQASILAILGMLSTSGPVKITRNDLAAVLGLPGAMTHFAYGSAEGPNRLHEALERAMKNPLLMLPNKGSALKEVATVLLLLRGPSDLSFAEVQLAVSEIERLAGERVQVKVGVHAVSSSGASLDLFLLASSGGEASASARTTEQPPANLFVSSQASTAHEEIISPAKKTVPRAKMPKVDALKQTQGVLNLENYQRGRFDKSEPTIVAGEDLDIPTFVRKGIKLVSPLRK